MPGQKSSEDDQHLSMWLIQQEHFLQNFQEKINVKYDCKAVSRLKCMEISVQRCLNDFGVYIPLSKMMCSI